MEIAVAVPAFLLPSSNKILLLQILSRILFLEWFNLRKHRWVTFAERRSVWARIFGKFLANGFFSGRSGTGKSENDRKNTGFMVGLGGLEPPTSPLSGAFIVLYA
jgi:hypothetical protein